MEKKLAGKVAWVTGSSRGLGRAIAAHLADLGASVDVHGTSPTSTRAFDEADSLEAVAAEILYLVNLLLLPGLAFIALLVVYFRHIKPAPALARCHLRQTLSASLWAGGLLLVASYLVWLERKLAQLCRSPRESTVEESGTL